MAKINIGLTADEEAALIEDLKKKLDGYMQWATFVGAPETLAIARAYQKLYNSLK